MRAGIAGAGLLGRLLAMRLIQSGWSVTLFDEQVDRHAQNCSMTAAGLLTPLTELERNDALIFSLGMESLHHHWPEILRHCDSSIYFQNTGSLVFAHPRDRAELTRYVAAIAAKLHGLSRNSSHCSLHDDMRVITKNQNETPEYYRLLDQEALEKLEPELGKMEQAYYFPDEGNLDNQTLLQKLGVFLQQHLEAWHTGVTVLATTPGAILCHLRTSSWQECRDPVRKDATLSRPCDLDPGIPAGTTYSNETTYSFDMVFDCRGLGAKTHFPKLRGVRGELFWLHAPNVHIQRPVRLLNPRYSLYIAPRPDSIYIVGASEIESEDQSPISARTLLELLSSACYLHSGFAEARLIKTMTHLRPTLADNLPKIKYMPQLIAINGLYRHGFLIAPAIIEEVLRYLRAGSQACHYPTLWEPFHASVLQ